LLVQARPLFLDDRTQKQKLPGSNLRRYQKSLLLEHGSFKKKNHALKGSNLMCV
jgi:hypothetical protein